MSIQLTEEQQAIVAHDYGPALVFAVAGSGKTTAMVHRIERLVREGIFPASQILATSFSRAAVDDIKKALSQWPHCSQIRVSTLHALAYSIIHFAQHQGYISLAPSAFDDIPNKAQQILHAAIREARFRKTPYYKELDTLDHEDFLNFIGSCKGNLRYADLHAAHLPEEALALASQANALKFVDWYLDFYRIFEEIRQTERLITFDDMLMMAWELLLRYPELKEIIQKRQHCILVDEFQDVNLVQSELLDILVQPHLNYMVIGDDDQTIYEWRGANTQFILNFERRYQAKKYIIQDNFRCKASHIAIANNVIKHNRLREPKYLNLTKGFSGKTFFHLEKDSSQSLIREIKKALQKGVPPDEIVILIRLYSQTPVFEQLLIDERIPYKIIGNSPFYERPEIQVLLSYLRIAIMERKLVTHEEISEEEFALYRQDWRKIYNRPNRYFSSENASLIFDRITSKNISLTASLYLSLPEAKSSLEKHLFKLARLLRWLASQTQSIDADKILPALDERLGYTKFLRRSSGFPETGEGRALNVKAFFNYAKGKGTVTQLLEHIDLIASLHQKNALSNKRNGIKIMSIFRAKGLEWSHVFVPNCEEGIIPFHSNGSKLEEERRLFYVAITRAKEELHLFTSTGRKPSSFLVEAEIAELIDTVGSIATALKKNKEDWTPKDSLLLAQKILPLHFDRYIAVWWQKTKKHKRWLIRQVQQFLHLAKEKDLLDFLEIGQEEFNFWKELKGWEKATKEKATPELIHYFEKLEEEKRQKQKRTDFKPKKRRRKLIINIQKDYQDSTYTVGLRVAHPKFGEGRITHVDLVQDQLRLTINFEKVGTKKIAPLYTTLTPLN